MIQFEATFQGTSYELEMQICQVKGLERCLAIMIQKSRIVLSLFY